MAKPQTVKELLYWSYANLAMAHAALKEGIPRYGRTSFMIRSRLYKGLMEGRLCVSNLALDDKVRLFLPQACAYCGRGARLEVDHIIPLHKGGKDQGENLIWACRSCNGSKGARDPLLWLLERGQFPPLLLLRRILKLGIELCQERGVLDAGLESAPDLPLSLAAIPTDFPQPSDLVLWVEPSGCDGVNG